MFDIEEKFMPYTARRYSVACQNLRVSRQKLFEIIDSGKPYKNKFYLIFDIEKEYV